MSKAGKMQFSATQRILQSAVRVLSRPLMRSGTSACLSILIYHRVLPEPDPLLIGDPTASVFERHVAILARNFKVLPLHEAIARLKSGRLPARAACITFDDGYADNACVALPILRRWNMPATFFISTGYLDGGCMWNDAVIESVRNVESTVLDLSSIDLGIHAVSTAEARQIVVGKLLATLKYLPPPQRVERVEKIASITNTVLPVDLMMTADQVRELSCAGMEIGGHTVSHPILASIDNAEAETEIRRGKEELEGITGEKVTSFAYPNGKPGIDYKRKHVEIVKSLGFSAAVSTSWGAARHGADIWQLPRFTPWDRRPHRFLLRLVNNSMRNRIATA